MRRWAFTLTSAISLVLFVGSVVLWVRSYWIASGFQATWTDGHLIDLDVQSESGAIQLAVIDHHGEPVKFVPIEFYTEEESEAAGGKLHALLHFAVFHEVTTIHSSTLANPADPHDSYLHIEFPYWALCLAIGIPAWMAVRRGFRRRTRSGKCSGCGYDLRATPDRCPECGAAVVRSAPAVPPSL